MNTAVALFALYVACIGLVKTWRLEMHVLVGINLATILLLAIYLVRLPS